MTIHFYPTDAMKYVSIAAVVAAILLCSVPGFAQESKTGLTPFSKAEPFTLPLIDGETWSYSEQFNWEDSWIFVIHDIGTSLSYAIWTRMSEIALEDMPRNTHIFFMSYNKNNPESYVRAKKTEMEALTATYGASEEAYWKTRMHYVSVTADSLEGWLGDVLRNEDYSYFGIDRFGQLREFGYLKNAALSGWPADANMVSSEAQYYNYEYERYQALQSTQALEFTVIDHDPTSGNRYSGDIVLPDAETMAQFDKLEIDMELACQDSIDENCFEWDYLAYLYLCDSDDPSKCSQEIGRWITSYHRMGRWVTDYTPFLPLFKDGGVKRFRFNAQDQWVVTVKLRFINSGASARPVELVPMMADSLYNRVLRFNESYNGYFPPFTFTVPEDVVRTDIAAMITGHGFGADVENCAEFCNHQHWFDVNGIQTYKKEHPEAGSAFGCLESVSKGVTPNQFGTWPYGRGGWCPGWDVPPFVADITSSLVEGENTITYRGLFNGQTYVPEATGESTFWAQLRTGLWLVYYKSKPVGVEQPQNVIPGFFTLHQNYPNPFHYGTVIEYDVRKAGNVTLTVYDAMGREVRTLVNGHKDQGAYKYRFEAVDMIPGVYWYTLHGNGWTESKRMVITK